MRSLAFALLAAGMAAVAAHAQDNAAGGPQNPAVKSPQANNSSTPVKGANSFTKSEAQARIEARGYQRVAGLHKDKDGIWRGTAEKDGKSSPVTLDYQGNVN